MHAESVAALINEMEPFTLDIRPVNKIHAWMQKMRLKPRQIVFKREYLCYASLMRISQRTEKFSAVGLFEDLNDMLTNSQQLFEIMSKYGTDLAEIVVISLTNKKPTKELVKLVMDNMRAEEFATAVTGALQSINITGFIIPISFMKGINLSERIERQTKTELNP